jgi:hypothetical protein
MIKIKNKKGIEFSFGWIFAMVVGAMIIFLAVYAAFQIVGSERTALEAESAKQLEMIMTPIETGIESGKIAGPIVFASETRIYNTCKSEGNFGEQLISTSTSMGVGKEWEEQGIPAKSYNKYLFSEDVVQGKEVYVFSKPFAMPFRISALLFLWTDKYCFVSPTNEIEYDVRELKLQNINMTDDITKCEKNSKKVCFYHELDECDIKINPSQKSVTRDGKTVFYEGPLIWGAIFSKPELYECQVKRLMKRASELAMLYLAKSEDISTKSAGCSSNIQINLVTYANSAGQISNSGEIAGIYFISDELNSKNKEMTCKLWGEG